MLGISNDKSLIIVLYILNVEEAIVEDLYVLQECLTSLRNAFILPQIHGHIIMFVLITDTHIILYRRA